MNNLTKRERPHDSITDHSVTKKHKPNSNRVQNTTQPTKCANKRRKRRRTRPSKARNKRALEAEAKCSPDLPRKKQKNIPQALQKKKFDQQALHDKTSTLEASSDESFHSCSSNPLHTPASPQSDLLLNTQEALPQQLSLQSKPPQSATEALARQSTNPEQLAPISPPLSSPESWQRMSPTLSPPTGSRPAMPLPSTLSLKSNHTSVCQTLPVLASMAKETEAVNNEPDSIVLISSSEEEDNNENAIMIADSDSDAEEEAPYATNPAQPLCTIDNKVSLYVNDLAYLNPKQWLNDTIIDFSVLMFQRTYNTESATFISSSFFFTRLLEEYQKGNDFYEKTKKWLKNADLFNKKLWLIPVCQRNHWYLIAVIRPGSSQRSYITVMDSLFQHRLEEASLIKEFLRRKLREDKGQELDTHNISNINIPQQNNHYDCGLFLLRSIEVLLRKRNRFIRLIKGEIDDDEADKSLWQRIPVCTRYQLRGKILAFSIGGQ